MQSSNPVLNRSSAFAPGHGQAYPGAAPYGQQQSPYGYGGSGMPPQQQYQGAPASSRPMTLDDVIVKTAITLGVVVASAAVAWYAIPTTFVGPAFLAGALVGFALAMVLSFSRKVNPVLVMLYAAAEGVFLGIGSKFIGSWVGNDVIVQAVLATMVTAGLTLATYKYFAIKVTPKFTKMVVIGTAGFAGVLLVNLLLSFFGISTGISGMGPMGLLFAAIGAGLAVFNLILDFDMIEQGVRQGAPQNEAWRAAFGLTVTLVWLYWNILRILAILRGGD
ncbi:Bax inhibitor-1/YccA family protein [Kribbella sp. C-35]|uniref:Bax inhibitor-1/YccA family protein n=1 Tax=Kribbella sp. C-35 TaxID=2789276 RepID=UPI00397CA5F8